MKPHTSYHASGQHHQKSFGKTFLPKKKQRPDVTFKGTVNVVSFGLASDEHKALSIRCEAQNFADVFEIPVAVVRPEKYRTHVYVDLVEPGVKPLLIPDSTVRQQATYKDAEPWIVLTLLEVAL